MFIEAEMFDDHGGWVLDQQFMDQMGSPYLMAHGLGIPVQDAATTVDCGTGGRFRLWVRTFDWVSPWHQSPSRDQAPLRLTPRQGAKRPAMQRLDRQDKGNNIEVSKTA